MIPDAEEVITVYLTGVVGDIVYGSPPDTLEDSWVRLTLLDAPSRDTADHLVAALVQVDCYAGRGEDGQDEANLLARTVRAALRDIHLADHAGATVTGARIDQHARIPDTAVEPARERVVITTTVWMH